MGLSMPTGRWLDSYGAVQALDLRSCDAAVRRNFAQFGEIGSYEINSY